MVSSYTVFPELIKLFFNIIGILFSNDFDKCSNFNEDPYFVVVYVKSSCETLNFFFPRLNALLQYIRTRVSILQSIIKNRDCQMIIFEWHCGGNFMVSIVLDKKLFVVIIFPSLLTLMPITNVIIYIVSCWLIKL